MALAIGPTLPPETVAPSGSTHGKLVVLPVEHRKPEERADATSLALDATSKANVRNVAQAERTANDGITAVQTLDATLGRVDELMNRVISVADTSPTYALDDRGREELNRIYDELRVEASSGIEDVRRARHELATTLETLQETIDILREGRGAFSQGAPNSEEKSVFERAESARERIVQNAEPSIRMQANEPPAVAQALLTIRTKR